MCVRPIFWSLRDFNETRKSCVLKKKIIILHNNLDPSFKRNIPSYRRNFVNNDKSDLREGRRFRTNGTLLFLRRGVWRLFRYFVGILAQVDSAPVCAHHVKNTVATRRHAGGKCQSTIYEFLSCEIERGSPQKFLPINLI